ncbi:hypothetical protein AB0A71_39120 [Kitasatospora aureofaciens]|uniref:hypothetical protein n=1 Tax=Kitasatospora aureofaciens TaxID=1894 RepID=UPI00340E32C9
MVIALFVLRVAVWLLGRAGFRTERGRSGAAGGPAEGRAAALVRRASTAPVRVAVVVVVLVVAVGTVITAYRIGDSGAKAVWRSRFSTSQSDGRR